MTESELLAMEKEILATIWTSNEAYETLRILCDEIGHRFGGSESERRGAEFLKQKMEEYGLENVRIEEFPMATWERGAAKLTLLEPVDSLIRWVDEHGPTVLSHRARGEAG